MRLNIISFKRNLTVLYNLLIQKIKVTFGSRKILKKEKEIMENNFLMFGYPMKKKIKYS